MMLNRGAAAGRALARAGSLRCAVRADATRAASNITIGANGVLKVPNDPIVPFIEVRARTRRRATLRAGPPSAAP